MLFWPVGEAFGDFWKNLEFEIVFNELDIAYGPQDRYTDNTRGNKDRHNIISAPSYGKFGNVRWQNNTKHNINNIVAAQGISPTGVELYSYITRRTLYACHVLVNTALRKLHSFR